MSSVAQSEPSSQSLPIRLQSRLSLAPSLSQASAAKYSRDSNVIRRFEVESEADVERRENDDAMNEIVMAVDMRDNGTVGCAYYIAREEKLCLMEDIKLAGLDIVDTLKLHANPTVILISTRSDQRLEEHLSSDARGFERGDDTSMYTYSNLVNAANFPLEMTYSVPIPWTPDHPPNLLMKVLKTSLSISNCFSMKNAILLLRRLETT